MELPDASRRTVRFAAFDLALPAGELRKHGITVKLQDQPLHLLAMLLEHPGEMVSRDALRQRLWPTDTFVDFEHGLNRAVNKVREALGDSAENPRFVETVPRHGYRFIAPAESISENKVELLPPELATVAAPNGAGTELGAPSQISVSRAKQPRWRRAAVIGVGALAVLLVGLLLGLKLRDFRVGPAPKAVPQELRSIVVLPLKNVSGDAGEDYFADGVTEALTGKLAVIRSLRVTSGTSALHYKSTRKTLPEVGRELNVDAVVEGTVARLGDRIRVAVQLIHAPTDDHLWAESYDRDLHDVQTLPGEVVRAIAQALKIELTPEEQARLSSPRPVKPEAHDAYLKGRYYQLQAGPENWQMSRKYFERAIDYDPAYAPAFSGLADTYSVLGYQGLLPPREAMPRAKAAAEKALVIDETLAEAHTSLAFVMLYYDWDWAGADKEFRRAIEFNPSYATAHHWYSHYWMAMDRPEESLAASERARSLDPLDLGISVHLGWHYYMAHMYDHVLEQCRNRLEIEKKFYQAHFFAGLAYEQKRSLDQAVAEFRQAVALGGDNPRALAALGHAYGLAGNKEEARKILHKLLARSGRPYISPAQVALVYVGTGEKERAFEWLERAYRDRCAELVELRVDPRFDSLRSDPRFTDLVRRVGPPQ